MLWCVTSVASDSVQPHRRQPTRLPLPWDSPGKNTGVDCHCLIICILDMYWASQNKHLLFKEKYCFEDMTDLSWWLCSPNPSASCLRRVWAQYSFIRWMNQFWLWWLYFRIKSFRVEYLTDNNDFSILFTQIRDNLYWFYFCHLNCCINLILCDLKLLKFDLEICYN